MGLISRLDHWKKTKGLGWPVLGEFPIKQSCVSKPQQGCVPTSTRSERPSFWCAQKRSFDGFPFFEGYMAFPSSNSSRRMPLGWVQIVIILVGFELMPVSDQKRMSSEHPFQWPRAWAGSPTRAGRVTSLHHNNNNIYLPANRYSVWLLGARAFLCPSKEFSL